MSAIGKDITETQRNSGLIRWLFFAAEKEQTNGIA
jgi:hypothetical protein